MANDTEYPDDYLTIGHSRASHRQMIAAAHAPVEASPVEAEVASEPTDERAPTDAWAPTLAEIEAVTEPSPVEETVAGDTD